MDLTSIKTIQNTLQTQGTRPRKGLGQNFLTSKEALGNILKAAELNRSETVLEIGPGIGTLTRELARCAKRVVAVEKDPAMVEILKQTTKDLPNIEIIRGDILKLDTAYHILHTRYKLVANLPYYITLPVIRKFLEETPNKPRLMVLMVQKEVAQRICARPTSPGRPARQDFVFSKSGGSPDGRAKPPRMSLLAVSVQFYAKPEIISYVAKTAFWPQPKVDSAILKITQKNAEPPKNLAELRYAQLNRAKFFTVVRAGFKQPRKQLLHNFVHEPSLMLDAWRLTTGGKRAWVEQWLKKNSINPTQRAETLTVQDWINLARDYTMEK